MNFNGIVIFVICIALGEVKTSPVGKFQKPHDNDLILETNGKYEQMKFDTEMREFSFSKIIKQVGKWFGITGEPGYDLRRELTFWPEAQVPYIIDENFDYYQQQVIMDAIDEFHTYTCIRFVPYDNDEVFINIKLGTDGCSSPVGYSGKSFDIQLESPGCGDIKGSVMHELMHVIGFIHEHSRHDRDDHVSIKWSNVISDPEVNFQKYQNTGLNDFGLPYDFGSLMHYSDDAFSYNGGKTIVAKDDENTEMRQRIGSSQIDIEKINAMCQCEFTR